MKIYFLFVLVLYSTIACAQRDTTDVSLDKYFAGIPLRESYENWVDYIVNNPNIAVDSLGQRGVYARLKPGMKSEFPFPGADKIKLLFQKIIYYDSVTNISTDSTWEISIEGIFPDNKTGRKESVQVFRYLIKCLKPNYKRTATKYSGRTLSFWNGRSETFPDCTVDQGYFDELGFYYVMLTYVRPRKNISDD